MALTTDFSGGSLPAGWSAFTPGTCTATVADGWLALTSDTSSRDSISASNGIHGAPGIYHALPAGAWDVAIQVSDDIGDTRSWGYNLIACDVDGEDHSGGGWARYGITRPNDTSERPNRFAGSRPAASGTGAGGTNHYNTHVNNAPLGLQSGVPAFIRLAFNGVDTFQPYVSTDGVTWVADTAFTRALAPTRLHVSFTSVTPNTAGTVRVAAVWDVTAAGTTDLRSTRPAITRTTVSSFLGTAGSLPANWANDSVTDTVTFTGTAVRLSSDAANVGSRARIYWTGTRNRSAGLLIRATWPTFDADLFNTFGLLTDDGTSGDVYVRDGGGYGLEVGHTPRRPIRVDNPTGSNVASVVGTTGLDEKRYAWLRDTTGTNLTVGAPTRMFRLERLCTSANPGGLAWWRVKEWADAGSLAASLAAEPSTWDLFEGQDDIERGALGPLIVLAHNNPVGGLVGTGQLDLLYVEYYSIGFDVIDATASPTLATLPLSAPQAGASVSAVPVRPTLPLVAPQAVVGTSAGPAAATLPVVAPQPGVAASAGLTVVTLPLTAGQATAGQSLDDFTIEATDMQATVTATELRSVAMGAAVIYRPSVEQLETTITSRQDPTAVAVSFTLTAADELDGTETWAAGEWGTPVLFGDGRWRTRASSPLIGAGEDLDPAAGTWHAWARVGNVGGVIKSVGIVLVLGEA